MHTRRGPVEVRLEGRGSPVLVLNGGHCSRKTRLSHERLVEHGFLVVTPSRPGYDDTPPELGRTAQDAADLLAALLDHLGVTQVDVIGISAAGPTALAFAQRHSSRIRRLVLESAVTMPWKAVTKVLSRIPFGFAEKQTWSAMRGFARRMPRAAVRLLLMELTTRPVDDVVESLSAEDFAYVLRMIETSKSGWGFINDLDHVVQDLNTITCPTLAMYSSYDKSVRPENSLRLVHEMPACQIYDSQADTHLLWIGRGAEEVWRRRLDFLRP